MALDAQTFLALVLNQRTALLAFIRAIVRDDHLAEDVFQEAFRKHADGKGHTLEYAIPWELLHGAGEVRPHGGDVTAACWTVHWAEADGRVWSGQLVDVLNPKVRGWTYQRSATWGKAVWHETGHLAPQTVQPRVFP